MVRLVLLLVVVFKFWMFFDALKRKAETYWFWVIMMVPGGGLLYFVMVRARDRDVQGIGRRLLSQLKKPPSVEELRHRLEESPSIINRIQYAQGLVDARQFAEAKHEFEVVLDARPDERDALFGQAVCAVELGSPDAAIEPLCAIIAEAPTYREFAAYPELAEAYSALGRVEESVALLRGLTKSHPRIGHVVLLAKYLTAAGDVEEASSVLTRALREYDTSPKHYRRQNSAWAREARRMLAVHASGVEAAR